MKGPTYYLQLITYNFFDFLILTFSRRIRLKPLFPVKQDFGYKDE